jgi:hypothetical protein
MNQKLLEEETDEEKRNTIRKLLAEEESREIPPSPKRPKREIRAPLRPRWFAPRSAGEDD